MKEGGKKKSIYKYGKRKDWIFILFLVLSLEEDFTGSNGKRERNPSVHGETVNKVRFEKQLLLLTFL